MNLEFLNGTDEQKGHWKAALGRLLNLPMAAMPLQVKVKFSDPGTVVNKGHKDLAITTWTYGSTASETVVRNDAPNFGNQRKSLEAEAAAVGVEFNSAKFYGETAAHELGHSAFASLPEEIRVKIAKLFGAKSDKISELSPTGADWEDKIIEGIAETFKEAFVPRRFRVFGNRTNRSISYTLFPRFRKLFREGIELSSGEGTDVPPYDLNVFGNKTGGAGQVYLPEAEGEGLFFEGSFGSGSIPGGLFTPIERWEPPEEASDNTLYKWYTAQSSTDTLLVPRGTHFAGSVIVPQDLEFFGPSLDFAPIHGAHRGEAGFAGAFTWAELNANPELEPPGPPSAFEFPFPEAIMGVVSVGLWFTYWKPSTGHWVCWDYRNGSILGFEPLYRFGNPHPKFPGSTTEHTGCWIIMKGDGRSGSTNEGDTFSIPIGTISLGSDVPSFAPVIDTCGGDMVKVRIFAKVTFKTSPSRQDSLATIHSRLPSFTLDRPGSPCKGDEIKLPSGLIVPGDSQMGMHPSRRPVLGH